MARLLKEFVGLEYDKALIQEAREQKKPVILKRAILQRADALNQNKRIYPRSVLEREVNNYKKLVAENRATGECVPGDTEVWTKDGWKKIENVHAGDEIYTINKETEEIELNKVERMVFKKNSSGKLYRFSNKSSFDMSLTEEHRILLWDRYHNSYTITAKELYEKLEENDSKISHSYMRRSGKWNGNYQEYIDVAGEKVKSEDWAAFLGIYLSEGYCGGTKGGKKTNIVGIAQVKEDVKILIRELINKLPFGFKEYNRQFICSNKKLHEELFPLGNSYNKYIPQYAKMWSNDLLNIMLDWLLIGDGRNRKDTKGKLIKEYVSASDRLADDVSDIMIKTGFGASFSKIYPKDREIEGRIILAENSKILNNVHQNEAKGIYLRCNFINKEIIDYDDYVYCPTVKNGTWMMRNREKGLICWTSNCDHPENSVVELKNVSHILRDIWWEGDDIMGTIEVLNTPSGKIIQDLMEASVRIGVSSRGTGETKTNNEGHEVVTEDFMLLCFDLVSEPSTHNAWLTESKNANINLNSFFNKNDRINRIANEILNK